MLQKPKFWFILSGAFFVIAVVAWRTSEEENPPLVVVSPVPNYGGDAWIATLPDANRWFDTGIPQPCNNDVWIEPKMISTTVKFRMRLGKRVQNAVYFSENPQKKTMVIQNAVAYTQCPLVERDQVHTIQLKVTDRGDLPTLRLFIRARVHDFSDDEIAGFGAAKTDFLRTREIFSQRVKEFKSHLP